MNSLWGAVCSLKIALGGLDLVLFDQFYSYLFTLNNIFTEKMEVKETKVALFFVFF